MSAYEVPQPILNSPFEEPREYWHIVEGELPERRPGRRSSLYYYRDPKAPPERYAGREAGIAIELKLVNRLRERVNEWRAQGYPGVTRTTAELLDWWRRAERDERKRLFFAQLEAAETIIFLNEARADFRQGLEIPRDDPSDEKQAEGYAGFTRYACKMATGTGKTTVMAMLAAWSILNKVNDRQDARFSDVVLIVCPNVTIRDRLRELDPEAGEASLYLTRDIVPPHLMPLLTQGRVLVVNWHVFEPQLAQVDGVSAKVLKAGVEVRRRETVVIGPKTTTARGKRYFAPAAFQAQVESGQLRVLNEEHDGAGHLIRAEVESVRYVKSDTALINDVLGREVGGKRNILIMNDEAHHAYRIKREEPDEQEDLSFGDVEEAEEFFKEATVWIDGLDRISKLRGINFCVDLSATPYFLGRVGQATNRPFPWVVSDFGLIEAIEAGLVKIPQLAVRDTTGAEIPGYFNIWHWILPQLTPSERGGKKASPKPEAILKYANHPIAMLGGLWEEESRKWAQTGDPRPPVFILVCRNVQIAKVIYEWLALNQPPIGIPPAKIESFVNNGTINTIRVDSKVVYETDSGEAKTEATKWMRFTLDTVGRRQWPLDGQGQPLYPAGFEEIARKLDKDLHPPGRDVRCIVSVGMLTEGWDCNTVTHVIGLRPFMSQLLCEQVVGRGLRRMNYELGEDGKFPEEVAKVFGVPFEVVPFKANKQPLPPPPVKRHHVHAIPAKAQFEIQFPRVEGYTQAIRNRVTVDWSAVAPLCLDPMNIPPEVEMKASLPTNRGRPSLTGPGRSEVVDLTPYRAQRRLQELVFDIAGVLTRDFLAQKRCEIPAHMLFPQMASLVRCYIDEKVEALAPAQKIDLWLSPYYGVLIERLFEDIHADTAQGEAPEVPRYETSRGPGSTADVDFFTKRDVREIVHSHLNYVVADTAKWEQSAAYFIDNHADVAAFVKNASLGFAISYLHNGQRHDYIPDFIIRLQGATRHHLILETKGYDPLKEIKAAAAQRWVNAVNADSTFGQWSYAVTEKMTDVSKRITEISLKWR